MVMIIFRFINKSRQQYSSPRRRQHLDGQKLPPGGKLIKYIDRIYVLQNRQVVPYLNIWGESVLNIKARR